jgi:tellurite methyltransferase
MGGSGDKRDWAGYYAKTFDRPPRPTVVFALDRFAAEERPSGFAVDLGAGGGRDVVEMLRRGWRVLAVDPEPASIAAIRARPDLPVDAALEGLTARMQEADWPDCDYVNSSFALPICPPAQFDTLWRRIVDSLRPGGRFSGQFYGDRDSWADRPNMTFHTREQVAALLEGLDVEMFDEEEEDSTTVRDEPKHWHIFHVVAQKPG